MSVASFVDAVVEEDGEEASSALANANNNAVAANDNATPITPSNNNTKRVIHYRVELPPSFHGNGKDKESFSLWKARLELAVKACADGQQQDIATILPTRLSGDALAYWLSLSPEVQQNYEQCTAKLNDVFGRKEFLLHFQTFVNARQRLPREPLEVYAAEVTRLVLEAFPNYGAPAIAMERFRRFIAGMDPILQAKCHEHGATTLEEALTIACKWERAQEALRLLPPPALMPAYTQVTTPSAPQGEPLSAMVSTKHSASQSDQSPDLMNAVKQLSEDVRALKLEVTHLRQHHDHSATHRPHYTDSSRRRPDSPNWSGRERGRDRQRYSPHTSPARYYHSSASSFHGSARPSGDYPHRSYSPGYRGGHYSPTPASPSPPPHQHHSASSYRFSHYSPDRRRYSSSPGSRYPEHGSSRRHSSYSSPPEPARNGHGSHSTYSSRERRPFSRERDHHVSFDEDISRQGNAW